MYHFKDKYIGPVEVDGKEFTVEVNIGWGTSKVAPIYTVLCHKPKFNFTMSITQDSAGTNLQAQITYVNNKYNDKEVELEKVKEVLFKEKLAE